MQIDTRILSPPIARASAPRGVSVPSFTLGAEVRTTRTRARQPAAALANLDAILALQAEEHPAERRRRGAGRGTTILDALDRLKVALLSGRVGAEDLRRLSQALRSALAPTGDPGLDAVLAEIDLRARVEIAKLERARALASAPSGTARERPAEPT